MSNLSFARACACLALAASLLVGGQAAALEIGQTKLFGIGVAGGYYTENLTAK